MTRVETLLTALAGYPSDRVARLMWMLEDQRRALLDAVRDLTPEDLGWQTAPGANTIGMLLAHIAFSEAHLVQVGVLGEAVGHAHDVIGLREEDEGVPLPPGGRPPAALAGREIAFYLDMLDRARAHTRAAARKLANADLDRVVVRRRADGGERLFNVGWVFYHMIEHEAGHRAQIGLLAHLRRPPSGG